MKKIYLLFLMLSCGLAYSQDNISIDSISQQFKIEEITVTSIYRNKNNDASELKVDKIQKLNIGQEPSFVFKSLPSIYARSDNGTEFGYGYFYIRGLDQTRINVTLDGMPWNEPEDFGVYFANSPDLMSSMHSIKIEKGASSKTSGIAACAGNVTLESVDLKNDTTSSVNITYGSFNTYKASITYNMGLKKGFGFHLRATQSGTDGYRNNSFNNSHALTAKLGYYFNNYHNITLLSINGFHKNGQGWIGGTLEELEKDVRYNGNTKIETDNWIQSINKLQYSGWISESSLLTASVYLQYQDGSYRMDLDNYMHKIVCDTTKYNVLYDYALTQYLYGGNIALKTKIDFVSLSGGLNLYKYSRRHYNGNKGINADPYDNTGTKTDITPFVNLDFDFNKIKFGGNLQIRDIRFRYIDSNDSIMRTITFAKNPNYEHIFINGGLYFSYAANEHHDIYTSLNVTNREATRSTMFGGNEYYDSCYYQNISPELVHDIEFSYNLKYNKISANVTAYFMYFKNELIVDGTTGENGIPSHINADKSFRTGIELTADWNIIKNLHLISNASFSVNRFSKDNIKVDSAKFVNIKNNVQPYSPTWTLNVDLVDSWKYKNILFTLGLNFDYKSKMYIDIFNAKKPPIEDIQYNEDELHYLSYTLTLNLYGNVNIKNICELGIKLNNITNKTNNYCYGSLNAKYEMLVIQEAGFNVLGTIKFFF